MLAVGYFVLSQCMRLTDVVLLSDTHWSSFGCSTIKSCKVRGPEVGEFMTMYFLFCLFFRCCQTSSRNIGCTVGLYCVYSKMNKVFWMFYRVLKRIKTYVRFAVSIDLLNSLVGPNRSSGLVLAELKNKQKSTDY